MQKSVEQRAVGMASGGMHHQAGGLVQHEDVVIFEHDVQRYILCYPFALGLLLRRELQNGAGMYSIARPQRGAVDSKLAILDPRSQARAGMFGKQLRRNLIEALPAEIERHLSA